MISENISILLADDDKDDCFLFNEVLDELSLSVDLGIVNDGDQLMQLLQNNTDQLPDILFLDLNMPRKNGFQCLEEIKKDSRLKTLPVIIYSTSFDENIADMLYRTGAHHYICKPAEFSLLKNKIHQAITLVVTNQYAQPPREKFVIGNFKKILH